MKTYITRIFKYGTLISCYLLIGSVLLQIYARFFMANTPPWTEEASRIFFIYTIAFASGLAVKSDYYVHLDLIFTKLSETAQHRLLLLVHLITALMFLVMFLYSFQLIDLGFREKSTSMDIPMAVAFVSILIMSGSVAYYTLLEVDRDIKNMRQ
ncbi:MAG: TRAP transporter small permease [Saprospiraceae bacterium]|nr:TRAP transporter small permease [Saprospiraceae bacterium]